MLIGDITNDYFRQYDPKDDKDKYSILYEFNRHCMLTEITGSIVWEVLDEVKNLEELNKE